MKFHRPGQQVCILLGMGGAMDDILTIGITDLPFFHLDRDRLGTPDTTFTTHLFIHSLKSFISLYKPVQSYMGRQHSQGHKEMHRGQNQDDAALATCFPLEINRHLECLIHTSPKAGVFLGCAKCAESSATKMNMQHLARSLIFLKYFREKNIYIFVIKCSGTMN